LLTRSI